MQIKHSSQFMKARQLRQVVIYLMQNLHLRGRPAPIIFVQIGQWMPYNFVADSFHTKKLCSRLSSSKLWFRWKIVVLRFWAPFGGGLRATYDVHLRLTGKRVADFLLVSIELFLLGVTAHALRAKIDKKSAISLQRGQLDPKFQVEGVAPTNHSSSQKTRLNDLSYGMKIKTDFSSVLSQFTGLTKRRSPFSWLDHPAFNEVQ